MKTVHKNKVKIFQKIMENLKGFRVANFHLDIIGTLKSSIFTTLELQELNNKCHYGEINTYFSKELEI